MPRILTKKSESLIRIKERDSIISKIKDCHTKHQEEQFHLNKNFQIEKISSVDVNIWDEIWENQTYIHIDSEGIPDRYAYRFLSHIFSNIEGKSFMTNMGVDFELVYYDPLANNPEYLITSSIIIPSFFKYWRINIYNCDMDNLHMIKDYLEDLHLSLEWTKFNFSVGS